MRTLFKYLGLLTFFIAFNLGMGYLLTGHLTTDQRTTFLQVSLIIAFIESLLFFALYFIGKYERKKSLEVYSELGKFNVRAEKCITVTGLEIVADEMREYYNKHRRNEGHLATYMEIKSYINGRIRSLEK